MVTGMMIMKMDKGLDTGPVALTGKVAIGENMTAGELHDRLMLKGASLMADAVGKLEDGDLPLAPQAEDGVTYARKIEKAETRIDFSRPATEVHNHIRGLAPFPGAWTEIPTEKRAERVKVHESRIGAGAGPAGTVLDAEPLTIACGEGAVRLARLQKAGGKVLDAADFLRGNALPAGSVIA